MSLIFLDTETTGIGQRDRIIQLSFLEVDRDTMKLHEDYAHNPVDIELWAMVTHHITPWMLRKCPDLIDTNAFKVLNALNVPENIFVIHNAEFDLGMLAKENFYPKAKIIDTYKVVRHLYPKLDSHKLIYLWYLMELDKKDMTKYEEALGRKVTPHDASGDVVYMNMLFNYILGEDADIEKMIELTNTRVLEYKFKFGKYSKTDNLKTIEEAVRDDKKYIDWMLKNIPDLTDDLRYTIEHWVDHYYGGK